MNENGKGDVRTKSQEARKGKGGVGCGKWFLINAIWASENAEMFLSCTRRKDRSASWEDRKVNGEKEIVDGEDKIASWKD